MEILVTSGSGEGPNTLAAFDRALFDAGIANFNLLVLSSVIPPGAKVRQKQVHLNDDDWGAKLYVVLAQKRETRVGEEAWAGIGWVQEESTGKGLFVEHEGSSRGEVETLISRSLDAMVSYRKGSFGPPQMALSGAACHESPVCALVAATYRVERWN